jgi:hypothetical protein
MKFATLNFHSLCFHDPDQFRRLWFFYKFRFGLARFAPLEPGSLKPRRDLHLIKFDGYGPFLLHKNVAVETSEPSLFPKPNRVEVEQSARTPWTSVAPASPNKRVFHLCDCERDGSRQDRQAAKIPPSSP